MPTREDAEALDAADPLAHWRGEFVIPDDDVVYLDGNSLGRTPRRTLERVRQVMEHEWAADLIGSWTHWVDLPRTVGDALCPVLGARPGEVVVHDSVTVNLHQLLHAALALRPGRSVVAVDAGEFPTDRYVVDAVAGQVGATVRHGFGRLDDVAVVVRSLVDYRSADTVDLVAETRRAREAGAVVIWDLSHAAGVLELDLDAAGVEFAVGCTYKFLNGGPGAPAFSFVAEHLVGRIDQPLRGWFGTRDQFAMRERFEPRPDISRLVPGTPGILGLTAALVGIEITAEAGISTIAAKARDLTAFALAHCDALGFESPTPVDARRRGGHVAVRHRDARVLTRRLADEFGVVADFREPDLVRLGCSPLTTRFVDVHDAFTALATIAATATTA
jgi:kynureninase